MRAFPIVLVACFAAAPAIAQIYPNVQAPDPHAMHTEQRRIFDQMLYEKEQEKQDAERLDLEKTAEKQAQARQDIAHTQAKQELERQDYSRSLARHDAARLAAEKAAQKH